VVQSVSRVPPASPSPPAPAHLSRTHPELVRRYGDQLWLDPGEPAAREHVLRVVMDVVRRYDVDGVTVRRLFLSLPGKGCGGTHRGFSRRRELAEIRPFERNEPGRVAAANINQFVQNVNQSIKAAKPWVKFGVSPFGIWRPGFPKQVQGLDTYANLYADSRLWLASGWLDYFSPQLYWPVDQPEQSFPALLNGGRGKTPKAAISGRA
jgi:uncharacterized lipoprotein YddW (UPF0748 family)